jgi:hypothetical protein
MGTAAQSTRGIRHRVIAVALIAVTFAAYWWWNQVPPMPVANDCPQDRLIIRREHDSVTAAQLPLLGATAEMPEFHDCQRFVVEARSPGATGRAEAGDHRLFGPLVAIWAAYDLGSRFPLAIQPVDSNPSGMVNAGSPTAPGAPALSVKAVPVAVIYDFDPKAGYAPLGIRPGFNCLYLWNAGSWQARLVNLGMETGPCEIAMDSSDRLIQGGVPLEVHAAPPPDHLTVADLPPVARWDWDSSQQIIQIRCGAEWCQVGGKGFRPPSSTEQSEAALAVQAVLEDMPPGFPQATPQMKSRVFAVKGWHDQQRLDVRDQAGTVILTGITGTVFPHPALDALPGTAFDKHDWLPSAYLYLTGSYVKGKVPLASGVTRVHLCKGSMEECGVDAARQACSSPAPATTESWWARLISGTDTTYRCVHRNSHGGMAIPATAARWNWSDRDAKTWIACPPQSCCTVN